MKHLFLILFAVFIFAGHFSAQENIEYDKILKTENLKFHDNEIRIYKKYATSTGLELFRFYEDDNERWKAEFYETIANKNSGGEIKLSVRKSELNSLKNPELIWMQILDTDVIHLPKMEQIQYKLSTKNKNYSSEDGEIVSSSTKNYIVDGVSFYLTVKNHKNQNDFNYDNP